MTKRTDQQIQRNEVVAAKEIEELRAAVGWERLEDKYDKILANSYAHFTLREDGQLLAFVNILSDGIVDAFLLDLMVYPSIQRRGVGKALVDAAIAGLTNDGIRCNHVTFDIRESVKDISARSDHVSLLLFRRTMKAHSLREATELTKLLNKAATAAEFKGAKAVTLDEALTRFTDLYPRQSQVVECRFFGGLSVDETASLNVSAPTIVRDWKFAQAWLLSFEKRQRA